MIETQGERDTCWDCNRKRELCFCSEISKFDLEPQIVLLVHPKEFKKTIGTFRIVKLSINNTLCIRGYGSDFDKSETLENIISNPSLFPVVLFPGEKSLNLDLLDHNQLRTHIPKDKRLVVLVIDGTWANARKMIRTSRKLCILPKISFVPKALSEYQIRKQPKPFCVSTVEAVHGLIESMNHAGLCPLPPNRAHEKMVIQFRKLVQTQISLQVGPVRY